MGLIHKNASTAGPVAPKGPAELNQHNNNNNIIMQTLDHEQQKVRDGISGEGEELSAEDESRINGNQNHEILNNHVQMELVGLTKNCTTEKKQKQQEETQTQASSLVRWERFLPVRSLKVLLVENDDSTRHVVCALLRNCGYEVVSVANGLQAWKVLEDLTAGVDLVLTEVVLPCLTGIGLLSKITCHKTCKNIPVIMMSSHDSMSIVFKCLSKGAVDFLVKPIRKHELKNLWQHVWRKCHSSSWTKMAVEVDSPRRMSPWNQYVDPPGSTCAQVIHSNPNANDNNRVPKTNGRDKQDDVFDIELEIGIASIPLLQPQGQWEEAPSNLQGCNKQKIFDKENIDEEKENRQVELTIERSNGVYRNQVTEPTCVVTNSNIESLFQVFDNQNGNVSTVKDKKSYANKEMPSFEFISKNLNGGGDLGISAQDQNILKQSDRSAFSRYNSASHQAPTGNVGSCSPIDSSEAAKTESLQCLQSYLNSMPPNHSNGSNNNNDMGSSTNNAFTKPSTTIDKPTQKLTVNYVHPSSAFQPVQNASPQPTPQATNMDLAENGEKQHIQVQHHHHHYHHHHHHHMHNMVAQHLVNHNDQSLENKTTTSHHDAPSDLLSIPIKSDVGNQSLNGSASRSNHGSNVQIGSNATLLEKVANVENEMRLVEKDGTTSGIRFETASATIHNRFAQREAALNKFRQKRKERCFEKKVRYHSRKKLAEQRPRVRGQFVRQIVDSNKEKYSHQ